MLANLWCKIKVKSSIAIKERIQDSWDLHLIFGRHFALPLSADFHVDSLINLLNMMFLIDAEFDDSTWNFKLWENSPKQQKYPIETDIEGEIYKYLFSNEVLGALKSQNSQNFIDRLYCVLDIYTYTSIQVYKENFIDSFYLFPCLCVCINAVQKLDINQNWNQKSSSLYWYNRLPQ